MCGNVLCMSSSGCYACFIEGGNSGLPAIALELVNLGLALSYVILTHEILELPPDLWSITTVYMIQQLLVLWFTSSPDVDLTPAKHAALLAHALGVCKAAGVLGVPYIDQGNMVAAAAAYAMRVHLS